MHLGHSPAQHHNRPLDRLGRNGMGKTLTSPLIIVLFSVLSFVTCGLFLPIWFYRTLRPNKFAQTIFMDENGLQNWGLAPIPQSQRVLSVLVLIGIVWWVIWAMNMWHTAQTGS
jgi:hypothetical protein